ncbi:hypothetical protein [Prosthecobacter sp.]|uniref:hypothetical protein n=1 Tax=Prosthecobacter sp. TaxID=1965333 RepID=UPI003784F311
MNSLLLVIARFFQRWRVWSWSLGLVLAMMLASCASPEGNDGLSGAPAPNVQGIYQGSYTYGGAYQKLKGHSVSFEISIRQMRGSSKISGVVKEAYTGSGTLKDGFVWSDIHGTCQTDSGYVHLKFRKTYRHSKEPSVMYSGSLPPGSSLLSGTWYLESKTADSGMFQISNIHVQ